MAPRSPIIRFLTPLIALLFLTAGLAGCLSGDDADVLGTFYPMTFLAQEIGGDAVTVGQIIPSGMEPHEWEPGVRDLTRLSQSRLVVAQGLDFEPWLQPLINNLEDRAPPVVQSGNRLAEIPALDRDEVDHGQDNDPATEPDDQNGHGHAQSESDEHPEVEELRLINRAQGNEVAEVHGNHWHGGLPPVLVGSHVSLGAVFIDHNGHKIQLGEDEGFSLGARLAAGAEEGIVDFDFHGDHLYLQALALGETRVVFQLIHDDHVEWEAPPLLVQVVDELDDHGHGPVDPHTWLDPVLLIEQARAVRDAMIQAFPGHEDTFRMNAAALIDRLDAVHAAYQENILNAECGTRNVVVQHNAFAYLGQRYDFEIHSVVGLSPQAEPNPRAVADAVNLALEHDLSIVFTETLANPTVMNAVAQDATAKGTTVEVRVLSPLERRAPQEIEAGLDLIDIMYNNLDNLTDAMRCTGT